MVDQKKIKLNAHPRGFHLITKEIVKHIPKLTGVVNVFIQHTSASLTINENADPTVREDFETHFNKLVSEKETHFKHTFEGPDDMTSHIKSSILGSSVSFPIKDGVPFGQIEKAFENGKLEELSIIELKNVKISILPKT